jgi:hypothetical protein
MMLPGLISVAFYRRRPPLGQVVLGLAATVALSAVLGYPFAGNPLSHGGPIIGPLAAAISGVVLYLAVVAFIYYYYREKLPNAAEVAPRGAPP